MKTLSGVYSTDGISRNGVRFSISALDDIVWDGSATGVPSNLSHDIHRFIGWTKISGLYVSHELSYVIGHTFIPESKDELDSLNKMRIDYLNGKMLDRINTYHSTFLKEIERYHLICDNGRLFCNGLVMYGDSGIVGKAFPWLNKQKDNDGLILLKDIYEGFSYLGQGVFASKESDLAIFLHPFFRKSFSRYNNYNFEFIDELLGQYQANQSIKIKIDDDFIGYSPSFIKNMEFEYWFGPKYDDDISKIPTGVTCYKSFEEEKFYNQVEKTEFVWQNKKDKFQFEMEEVSDSDAPTLDDEQYACRYLHSIYDYETSAFDHFDGAVRQYNIDSICERLEKPINQMGHNAKYTKLFRLDGEIPLATWKSLITYYLKNNYDVYRYFGLDIPIVQETSKEKSHNSIERYVPYLINKGDGVRLYISYHEKRDSSLDFSFCTTDVMTSNEGEIEVVEYEAINVAKAIRRMGGTIKLPQCAFCTCEDNYNNIPRIFHGGEDVFKNVNITVKAIRFLMAKQSEMGKDNIYSFSLAWNMDDRLVSVSFMGHIYDIYEWLQSFQDIPVDRSSFKEWLDKQVPYIHAHGRNADSPLGSSLIKEDGMLFFQRRIINNDVEIKDIHYDKDKTGISLDLVIDEDKPELVGYIKNNELTYTYTSIVKHSICEESNGDYLNSPLISSIDETTAILDGAKIQGFVWKIQS